ncbi:uncharacterized protein RCC_09881 [Ramularia collo-cygni]|uniref:Uncharacterized protein n=1 Tax=Ramularia collo-cygni TaxID=112498 RepID=A0A2D3VMW4_9PEZI|nr:uncharacterized protein RCC_09881 [Ramularia collo-cygni]CZT24164.1 uncharacterized protein RCC_09881 [Ramularia collo-cygni]
MEANDASKPSPLRIARIEPASSNTRVEKKLHTTASDSAVLTHTVPTTDGDSATRALPMPPPPTRAFDYTGSEYFSLDSFPAIDSPSLSQAALLSYINQDRAAPSNATCEATISTTLNLASITNLQVAASLRPLETLILSCAQEIQDEILHYTLAATLPPTQHLHWIEGESKYIVSPLQNHPQAPLLFPERYDNDGVVEMKGPCRINDRTYFYIPRGVWWFSGVRSDGCMKYRRKLDGDLLKDRVVVLDFMYRVPAALQIDSKTRAFWEKVFYEDRVFWIRDQDRDAFRVWARGLSEEQVEKMTILSKLGY